MYGHAPHNKRLERTRHKRASLLSSVGEPLKRGVGWLSMRGGAMSIFEKETVHTVNDYWDGPRVGVADFHGQPHYFECVFDEASDDWTSVFWLHSLEPETFNLEMENWSFWERWRDAFNNGEVGDDSHPCLPEDRAKYEANSVVLKERLRIDRESDIRAEGLFEIVGPSGQPTNKRTWTVTWQEFPHGAIQQALGADSP